MDKSIEFSFSQRACRSHRQPIGYLIAQAVNNPNLISFAAGLVDYQTLPAAEVRSLIHEILADDRSAQAALQYGTTEGLAALRSAILEHLASLDGVPTSHYGAGIEDIIVSSGSQQLLFILTDILVDPGDIVITAWPSYFVYTGVLETIGAQVRCVDMDEDGIIPQSLDNTLADLDRQGLLPRVKIVYITSYHQNPTGLTLSEDRRPAVLDIVKKYSRQHRILLIEDAAYRELTFAGSPPHSIKMHDKDNQYVALLQTFSKPFAPGVKTGFGVLPSDLVPAVVNQKSCHDFGSANICQHLLLKAMTSGIYESHLDVLRKNYRLKCDAMLKALASELGDFAPGVTHWTKPSGGLYVYLTLPPEMNTGPDGELFHNALNNGVLYVPGEYCYGPDPTRTVPQSTMRLTFGVANSEQIKTGIGRLAKAVRQAWK